MYSNITNVSLIISNYLFINKMNWRINYEGI